jgi:hypothetical protein
MRPCSLHAAGVVERRWCRRCVFLGDRYMASAAGGCSRGRHEAGRLACWGWRCAGGVMVAQPAVAPLGVCERRYGGVAGDGLGSAH